MDTDSGQTNPASTPAQGGVFFDGASSRRRLVALKLSDALEIREDGELLARWAYADIRRADSPSGLLRLSCLTAPQLARLEIRDAQLIAALVARCDTLEEGLPNRKGVAAIVGWSLAAAVSIVLVVLFGVPLAADRLTPLVPDSFERRLGDVAEAQVSAVRRQAVQRRGGASGIREARRQIAGVRRPRQFGAVGRAGDAGAERLRAAGR